MRTGKTYTYPARMFISELLPAPEGPIMAVRCPDRKNPFILFSIVLCPVKHGTSIIARTQASKLQLILLNYYYYPTISVFFFL